MAVKYDKHYTTHNLFGDPYPELIHLFASYSRRGRVLDVGCGQGRDAIALATLGFEVTGIDNSEVGIAQMQARARADTLPLRGIVTDIFSYEEFSGFNFVLFDSMFHFLKRDRDREIDLIRRVIARVDPTTVLVFCIQDRGKKVETLYHALHLATAPSVTTEQGFKYVFKDPESQAPTAIPYKMIVVHSFIPRPTHPK